MQSIGLILMRSFGRISNRELSALKGRQCSLNLISSISQIKKERVQNGQELILNFTTI